MSKQQSSRDDGDLERGEQEALDALLRQISHLSGCSVGACLAECWDELEAFATAVRASSPPPCTCGEQNNKLGLRTQWSPLCPVHPTPTGPSLEKLAGKSSPLQEQTGAPIERGEKLNPYPPQEQTGDEPIRATATEPGTVADQRDHQQPY